MQVVYHIRWQNAVQERKALQYSYKLHVLKYSNKTVCLPLFHWPVQCLVGWLCRHSANSPVLLCWHPSWNAILAPFKWMKVLFAHAKLKLISQQPWLAKKRGMKESSCKGYKLHTYICITYLSNKSVCAINRQSLRPKRFKPGVDRYSLKMRALPIKKCFIIIT